MTRPVIKIPARLAAIQPLEVRARLAKNPAAVQRGHTARATGAKAEMIAHAELDDAVRAGRLAWWRAVGAPTKHTRTGLVYAGKGPCDIVAMTSRGRCLVAEIKSGAQLWQSPSAKRGGGPAMAEHQSAQLDATARNGGLALVAFHSRGALHWYTWPLPWRDGRVIAVPGNVFTLNDTLEMIDQ